MKSTCGKINKIKNQFFLCFSVVVIFLPAVSGNSELKIGIPDFENFSIWRFEEVSLAFSVVFM